MSTTQKTSCIKLFLQGRSLREANALQRPAGSSAAELCVGVASLCVGEASASTDRLELASPCYPRVPRHATPCEAAPGGGLELALERNRSKAHVRYAAGSKPSYPLARVRASQSEAAPGAQPRAAQALPLLCECELRSEISARASPS